MNTFNTIIKTFVHNPYLNYDFVLVVINEQICSSKEICRSEDVIQDFIKKGPKYGSTKHAKRENLIFQ